MKMKTMILGCWFLLLGTTTLFAQQGPVASGGVLSGSGGTASYSIGQIDYSTATGTGGIITEGLQQPYEIFLDVENIVSQFFINVYPNPSNSAVFLDISENNLQNLEYTLSDILGKIIERAEITNQRTTIAMHQCQPGVYILSVYKNQHKEKIFKIIKSL